MLCATLNQAEYPSAVGVREDGEAPAAMETDDPASIQARPKKYYMDTVNLKVARTGMEMGSFLEQGMGQLAFIIIMYYSWSRRWVSLHL